MNEWSPEPIAAGNPVGELVCINRDPADPCEGRVEHRAPFPGALAGYPRCAAPLVMWQCSAHEEHRGWRYPDEPRGDCDRCGARTKYESQQLQVLGCLDDRGAPAMGTPEQEATIITRDRVWLGEIRMAYSRQEALTGPIIATEAKIRQELVASVGYSDAINRIAPIIENMEGRYPEQVIARAVLAALGACEKVDQEESEDVDIGGIMAKKYRHADDLTRERVIELTACENCGAKKGEPCKQNMTKLKRSLKAPTPTHFDRIREARRLTRV